MLDAFLAGEHPTLHTLRQQAAVCSVSARRHTGVSAFADLQVPEDMPRASPPAMTFGDLDLQADDLPQGATAMLFVRRGALARLEFVTNAGAWPEHPTGVRISYIQYQRNAAGGYALIPTSTRDPATLALQLAGHASSTK